MADVAEVEPVDVAEVEPVEVAVAEEEDEEAPIMPEDDIMDQLTFRETFTDISASMDEYRRTGVMPNLPGAKQRNREKGSELDRSKLRKARRDERWAEEQSAKSAIASRQPAEPKHIASPEAAMSTAARNKARRDKYRAKEDSVVAAGELAKDADGATSSGGASSGGAASPSADPKHMSAPLSPMSSAAKNKARRDKYRTKEDSVVAAEDADGAASPAGAASPVADPKHAASPASPMSSASKNKERRDKYRAKTEADAGGVSGGGCAANAAPAGAATNASASAAGQAADVAAADAVGGQAPPSKKNTWDLRDEGPATSATIYMRNKERRDAYRSKTDPDFVRSSPSASPAAATKAGAVSDEAAASPARQDISMDIARQKQEAKDRRKKHTGASGALGCEVTFG